MQNPGASSEDPDPPRTVKSEGARPASLPSSLAWAWGGGNGVVDDDADPTFRTLPSWGPQGPSALHP